MAIRTLLKMGNPQLLEVAKPIDDFDTPEIHTLIQDMMDTMAHFNGAGLAAPQIGESVRLVIFGVQANPRYPHAEAVPTTVLINPKISLLTDQQEGDWEGCLSVPGLRGYVKRPNKIRYAGYDQYGQPIDRTVEGFHARVVQHEVDHLDGILYPMRMDDMRLFGFEDTLLQMSNEGW